MNHVVKTALCVGAVLILFGCNYRRDKVGRSTNQVAEASFTYIQKAIIQPRCVSCHGAGGAGHVNLTSYAGTMKTVVPGKPDESPLYVQVRDDLMPENDTPLKAEEKALIKTWIEQGAIEGSPTAGRPPAPPAVRPPPAKEPPATDPDPDNGSPITDHGKKSTYEWIRTNVIVPKCGTCHVDRQRGDVDFRTFEAVKAYVSPGDPGKSSFYLEVVGEQRMPPGKNPKLVEEETRAIFDWIKEGAHEK